MPKSDLFVWFVVGDPDKKPPRPLLRKNWIRFIIFFSKTLRLCQTDHLSDRARTSKLSGVTSKQSKLNKVKHSRKSKLIRFAPKGSWWHHNTATFFRLIRQSMGLMTSQLCRFRAMSILWAFVVTKLILLFTTVGWSAQPYSTNFYAGSVSLPWRNFLLNKAYLNHSNQCKQTFKFKPFETTPCYFSTFLTMPL